MNGQGYALSSDHNFVNCIASTVAYNHAYTDYLLLYSQKSSEPVYLQHKIRSIYYYEVREDHTSILKGKIFFDSIGCWTGSEYRADDTLINRWDAKEAVYIYNKYDKKVREIRDVTYHRGIADTVTRARCSYNSKGLLSSMEIDGKPCNSDIEFQYDEDDNLLGCKRYTCQSRYHGEGRAPVVLTYKFNQYYLVDTILMARRYVWGLFTGADYPVKITQYDSSGRIVCNTETDVLVPDFFVYRYDNDSVYVCKNTTVFCGSPCPDSLASIILKLNDEGLPVYQENGRNTPYQIVRYRYEYHYW